LDNFIIDKYKENFDSNNENIIGRNAVVSVGSTLAATDSEEVKKINHIFLNTVKEKGVKATNQGYSGRCWIFAGLNMFRHLVIKALKLDNYEFSQTYLFFWDKLERANRYIHLFIDGVNGDGDSDGDSNSNDNGLKEIEPGIGDINFDYYAETFLSDGGYWSMFANLVDKYGLVPSGAMPETWQSCDSEDMNNI
jgi:bleomycin hydrolase